MEKNAVFGQASLARFHLHKNDPEQQNRMLLEWLSDDEERARLFEQIDSQLGGSLEFPSRVGAAEPCCVDDEQPRPPPQTGHRTVRLITDRTEIEKALRDGGPEYSSRPYGDLGGGNFTLAFDPASTGAAAQAAQWQALSRSFPHDNDSLARVAHHACEAAAVLSLRGPNFDLAEFAEQAVLRFCQALFGYALDDFRLLESALRASYRALVYQVLGRHFTTDPLVIPEARREAGQLLKRTAQLIEAYAARDEDLLKYVRPPRALTGIRPVLEGLAQCPLSLNGEQRAVVAVGAAVGTVGNVQAAVCIAVKALLNDEQDFEAAKALAQSRDDRRQLPSKKHAQWKALIVKALNRNPPIPFLPRTQIVPGAKGPHRFSDVVLALGGGTRTHRGGDEDLLIWGLPSRGGCPWDPPRSDGRHACFGRPIAWPLIIEIVRHVMGLSGLAEQLDPLDATVIGLHKRWGFAAERYPLSHQRDKRVTQATLNVHMRIKQPVQDNANRLREVIRGGAPLIDEVLRDSSHVHFAWFEIIERDTVLVLHTVYDGDFAAYIEHFARRVGQLFDLLFESIEDAPPAPVDKYPNEFVALIRRYDRAPAMGYFFSAYPHSPVEKITRAERGLP
jgi:hypothetical protein